MIFHITMETDEDGWIVATCPALPGCMTQGITAGDIEFEQHQTKIFNLTTAISIMVAGDLSTQAAILLEVMDAVESRVATEPDNWWTVKEVADLLYARLTAFTKNHAAERILSPLGLDLAKLTSPDVAPGLAEQLAKEVLDFRTPSIAALVIGIDTRAHIYEVNNEGVICHDWTGFASVGGGAWHSNSQLMFAGHSKSKELGETVMSVYTAKRRAEVAPGVGEITDMIAIGPRRGESTTIGLPLMSLLRETYEEAKTQAEKVRDDANAKIAQFFEAAVGEAPIQTQSSAHLEARSGQDATPLLEVAGEEPAG